MGFSSHVRSHVLLVFLHLMCLLFGNLCITGLTYTSTSPTVARSICINGLKTKLSTFFWLCFKRTKKAFYKDMLISFKKTQKMTRLKSPSLESLNMQKLFFKKESLCLMHRLSTFLILFPSNVSPNMQLKKKKILS